jgi:hypothetical protein
MLGGLIAAKLSNTGDGRWPGGFASVTQREPYPLEHYTLKPFRLEAPATRMGGMMLSRG